MRSLMLLSISVITTFVVAVTPVGSSWYYKGILLQQIVNSIKNNSFKAISYFCNAFTFKENNNSVM